MIKEVETLSKMKSFSRRSFNYFFNSFNSANNNIHRGIGIGREKNIYTELYIGLRRDSRKIIWNDF